jgi:hypothetical protein
LPYRGEVPVDDVVEQAVQQQGDPVCCRSRRTVPAGNQLVEVERGVLTDGDQRLRREDDRELAHRQSRAVRGDGDRVDTEEVMGAVAVEFRPLSLVQRVLESQLMETEFLADRRELGTVRAVQVQPHDRRRIRQMPGDVADREVLLDQGAVAVQPSTGHVAHPNGTSGASADTTTGHPPRRVGQ